LKNVNLDKINNLLSLFCELDDEFQIDLIGKAYELTIKQATMKNKSKQGEFDYSQWKRLKNESHTSEGKSNSLQLKELEKSINSEISSKGRDLLDMHNNIKKLDEEGNALIAMMMESLKPGSMTLEEELTVTINKRQLSLQDYNEKKFPNLDYLTLKAKFEKLKEDIN
jgi:hypothetical protein